MKLRILLLSFLVLAGVNVAQAESPEQQLALDTTPIGARTAPLLSSSLNVAPKPLISASEQLGSELGKMFQEGATKLDKPRPKGYDSDAAPGGLSPSGGRTLNVMAYSYCINGRTASGHRTAHGIVAVDTRVIPMGSRLFIPGYGWAIASDTGGAIQGHKIDVWFPSLGQCYQWGVRPVTIQVFTKK